MTLALESLTFSVETKELENAIQKIKELGQAASSLNKPIEQLARTATDAGKKVEKASEAAEKMASSAESTSSSTKKLSNTSEELGKETDAVATKIERLIKQLSYLRNDQQLSVTGFTKSQAGLMAWADSVGATSEQLKMLSKVQDELNSIMGEQAFDKSVAGLNMLNRQLKEFAIMQELAGSRANLTSTQVKQLTRDMEVLRQRNISLGKDSESGIAQLKSDFMEAANRVNELAAAAKLQEKEAAKQNAALAQQNKLLEEQSRYMDSAVQKWKALQIAKADQEANKQLAEQERLLKQNATAMDAVVNRWKQMQAQKADQEANKQLTEQNRLMQQGLTAMDSAVQKYKALQIAKADQESNKQLAEQNRLIQQGLAMMDSAVQKYKASQIAKEQEQLNEQLREQNRLQQQGATAMDAAVIEFYNRKHQALQDLVKAEQFLATQEEKLQFVTAKTAEGFTVASANALYRYEQSLKKAGVTEQEFIGRSSAYATALKARQDVSDANRGKIQATQELIRIEQQLEDQEKFLAYATAEFSKQQQQATAGTQNFSDTLNVGMLRSLFAYEQALRRAGVAEADVVTKSAAMRQQMIQMQQATESFNGSVNHLGRNIGVQFTDIFVSLYNGQPIMQVITQQGGQLADAFLLAGVSGANMSQHLVDGFKKILESYKLLGNAFVGLTGAGLEKFFSIFDNGLVNISKSIDKTTADSERFGLAMQGMSEIAGSALRANLILIGVAVAAMAVELLKADFAVDKLNKTLIQYGASLGITAQQGEALAMQVGEATTASIGSAREAILAFAKEGVEVTAESVAKAVELNDYLGISFEDAAKKAAQFKKEPVEALIEMAKKTGEVDLETLKYVSSLELAGDQQGAIKAAIEAKDRAETAAITRARAGLSEVSKAWLAIKQQISQAFDELVVFLTSSKEMRTVYAGLGAAITLIFHTVAKAYEGIRGIFSVLAAALTGNFDNVNSAINESANRINNLDNSAKEMYQKLLAFATADTKVNNDASEAAARRAKENAKAAGQFEKEQGLRKQLAKDLGKADADKLSKQAYINASIAEEMRLLGFVTKDQELLNALTKKYGEEWEKANKKTGKPGTTFTTNTGNQIVETSKQFEQRLQLEQRLVANQVKTLENYYEAGLYSMGSFLAQETNAVIASKEKQLQILEEYSRAELAAYDERQAKLEANAAIEIAKGGDRKAIYEQLDRELKNLVLSKQTFNEKITGQQETVYSNALKTLSKSMDEVSKITGVVTKEIADFNEELDKQQQARKSDIDFMSQTMGMTEREIAVLKAKNAVIEQSNKLAMNTAKAQAAAEATFWEYVQNIDPMQPEALDKAWGMWQQIQKSKEAMIAAGIRSEEEQRQAMSDAALAYDLANYKKLKDGIADAISTALFEGGQQGGKKLRDIIVAELRKPITLVIDAVVNVGLSAFGLNPSSTATSESFTKLTDTAISAFNAFTNKGSIASSLQTGLETIGNELYFKGSKDLAMSTYDAAGTISKFSKEIDMAGDALGYLNAAYTFSQGNYGEAAGQSIGTYFGGPIGATVGGEIGKVVDNLFGWGDKEPRLYYQTGGGDFEDKYSVKGVYGEIGLADNPSKNVDAASMKDTFQAIADLDAAIAATLDPLQNAKIQEALNNYTSGKNAKLPDYMAARIKIMADEIGGAIDQLIDDFQGGSEDLIAYMLEVTQAKPVIESLNFLGRNFDTTAKSSVEVAVELGRLAGGYGNLQSAMGTYYSKFYSEEEQTANSVAQLSSTFNELGLGSLPASREAYRSLVDAQDLTTASGREMFTSLIALAPAFDSIVDSAESVEQAYARLRTVNLSNEQIAQQRIDLEDKLFGITADTNAIRTRELELIDPSNRALQERIWALEDEAEAAKVAAEAAKAAADERLGLEQQLLQLQSNTTELRRRELEQIDPSNQALQQRIWALEDEATAADNAAAAHQSMIDMIGLSANSLSSAFKQIMTEASSAEEARKLGEEAASGMIAEAIANTMIGTVSNLVSTAILQPMTTQLVRAASASAGMDVTASATSATTLTAGAATAGTALAAGGVAAAGALDSVVAQAVSAARSMAEVLQDVSFQDAMADVVDAIGEISDSLYTNINSTQEVAASLESVSNSITEAARQFRDVTEFDLSKALINAMDIDHYINRASASAQSALEKYPVAEVDWGVFDQYKQWHNKLLEANQEMQDLELGRIPGADDSVYAEIQSRIRQALKMLEELGPQIGGSAFSLIDVVSASASDLGEAFSELAQAAYVGENETPFDALNEYIAGFSEDSQTAAGMISQTAGYFSDLSDGIASVMEAVAAVGADRLEFESSDWAGQYFSENSEMFAIIGEAAGRFSDTIIETIAGDTIAALESNPILDSLSSENLQSLGIVISQVTEGAIPQLVAAFDTLNVALASGAITAAQYDALVETTLGQFQGANAAAEAIETVAEAYERLTNVVRTNADIAQEQIDLEERLFNATATEEQIANKAREAIDAHNKALYDEVIAAEKAKAIADERLGLETQLLQLLGDTDSLRALELAKLDQTNRSLQEHIWLIEDSKAATDSALEQVKKIADAQIAELENSFKATDDALSKVQRSIDFQREEINKQLESANEVQSELTAIFDLLSNAISELLGEVKTETGNLLYKQAREIIASALSTGTLPSQDFLSEAVSAASSGLSELNFATKADRDRAYIGLANELEALNSLQEPQLSAAEQQIKLLEEQLTVLDSQSEQAKQTVNALRGIDESVVEVDAAINELKQAVATEESARSQIAAIQEQVKSAQMQYDVLRGIDTGIKSVEDAVRDLQAAIEAEIEASKTKTPVKPPDVSTITTTQGAASAGYITSSVSSSGSYTGIGDSGYRIKTTSSGATLYFPGGGSHSVQGSDAASILSSTYGLTSGGLNGTLIRTRAEGGYTPSGLTLVGEEGPELVNFKAPSMVYTAAQSANLMRGDNTELVSELQALRKEVAMLRAEARATAVNTSKTARILDDVTQGGDTIKTEVAV